MENYCIVRGQKSFRGISSIPLMRRKHFRNVNYEEKGITKRPFPWYCSYWRRLTHCSNHKRNGKRFLWFYHLVVIIIVRIIIILLYRYSKENNLTRANVGGKVFLGYTLWELLLKHSQYHKTSIKRFFVKTLLHDLEKYFERTLMMTSYKKSQWLCNFP